MLYEAVRNHLATLLAEASEVGRCRGAGCSVRCRHVREALEYEAGAFGGWHELVKNRFFYLATHDARVYVRKGEENLRVFRLP